MIKRTMFQKLLIFLKLKPKYTEQELWEIRDKILSDMNQEFGYKFKIGK